MKTEFQVRNSSVHHHTQWTEELSQLQQHSRITSADTLWRRQSETEQEAAVRRMAALDKWWRDKDSPMRLHYEADTPATFADRLSPPPAATETQVEWDTLEPVKEVPVWELSGPGVWVAGVSGFQWNRQTAAGCYEWLICRTAAIGHTRESALRNLAELQQSRK